MTGTAVGKIAGVRVTAADLAAYATPTLVISGDEDVLFTPEALASVAETIPDARLERFNRVVLEFLEANP